MINDEELRNRLQRMVGKELTVQNLEEVIFFDMPNAKGKWDIRYDGIHLTLTDAWSTILLSGASPVRVGIEERDNGWFVLEIVKENLKGASQSENNVYLTDEEKAIIVDFVSCAYGEGYRGGHTFPDIDKKLVIIAKKLGFFRTEIGIENAKCVRTFSKDSIIVNEGEYCDFTQCVCDSNSIYITTPTPRRKSLKLTKEEVDLYFE